MFSGDRSLTTTSPGTNFGFGNVLERLFDNFRVCLVFACFSGEKLLFLVKTIKTVTTNITKMNSNNMKILFLNCVLTSRKSIHILINSVKINDH